MTTLPFTVPNVFANSTSNIALSLLDADFISVTDAINGIGNGSTALTSVNITGGSVSNVSFSGGGGTGDIGRNLLHNSMFNIQQRGVGPFTATGYTADRWAAAISGSTMSVSIAPLPAGSLPGQEGITNYFANGFTGGSGAGDYVIVYQHIEGVQRTSGTTVTLSFWANATTGGTKLGVTYSQNFGTGGSAAVGPVSLGTVTLSSTLTRYTLTAAIPSVAGKTIGTGGLNSFQISFWYSAGSNYAAATGIGVQSGTISLAGVQLEVGGVATPLEKPDPRYDLANCQRFYCKCNAWHIGDATSGGLYGVSVPFPVEMRAPPTITSLSQSAAGGGPGVIGVRGSFAGVIGTRSTAWLGTASATGSGAGFTDTFSASADL